MNRVFCLFPAAMPLVSQAHTDGTSGTPLIHMLQHGGDTLMLSLGVAVIGAWLLSRPRKGS